MNQKVLIVEDDRLFATILKDAVEQAGYEVTVAYSAEEAIEKFKANYPCMILLDLILPGMSGEAFCQWVREQNTQDVSIIMISSKLLVEDKINGLKIGADAYLTKPIDINELLAHMEAVIRRTGLFCQKLIRDGLCIKPRKGEVLLYGKPVKLTKHEFLLLYYFMDHPNVILSREDLVRHLYPNIEREILDRTIDAHIKKLREKIEEDRHNPKRIVTVRGLGYKFVTPL
ncbi:response regulator transcription factor [Lysinibacillus sp. KU-BSD001]|uniref:response regulator transcription factor n=1 Tax=Lysinibacillus sp. KU-BSD001 TaxID=3141328 RepID=UPI0036EB687E